MVLMIMRKIQSLLINFIDFKTNKLNNTDNLTCTDIRFQLFVI